MSTQESQKHTPGPWGWQKFGDQYCLTAQHGMREIIISANPVRNSVQPMVVMNNDGILQPVNPDHPNAKLLAAAPLLREENEKLKDEVKRARQFLDEAEAIKRRFEDSERWIQNDGSILAGDSISATILHRVKNFSKLERENEALVKRVAELEAENKSLTEDYKYFKEESFKKMAENKRLREALESVIRHGLIEQDGYESVLSKVTAALKTPHSDDKV